MAHVTGQLIHFCIFNLIYFFITGIGLQYVAKRRGTNQVVYYINTDYQMDKGKDQTSSGNIIFNLFLI